MVPGLTFTQSGRDGALDESLTGRAQTLLLHAKHYRIHSLVKRHGLYLGWVAYDEYPVRTFSDAGVEIYFEGRIYNRPGEMVRAELSALAGSALGPNRDDTAVERFMLTNEGSYVVAMVRIETGEAVIFNDAFGRLPLYYNASESSVALSREAKFVQALRPGPAFDRIGCAQFLAFGVPLGDRTVLDNVRSFPDAGLLRIEPVWGRLRWSLRSFQTWNLDEEDSSPSLERQAGEFADLFSVACRNWGSHPDSGGNLVSLSGGHDSRAVAAGLVRSGSPVMAITYRDPSGKREMEVHYAKQLAEALRIDWHCIDIGPPPVSAYGNLAWLKDGMNWTSMAYMLEYVETIAHRWGRDHTYLSGDGGDDCLKVTAPGHRFAHVDEVVQHILDKETCIPADQAELALKLPAGTLREQLEDLFKSYPEQNLARRVKHFKIFGRGRRCYFEGEDRTRAFLWQDSPFYSLPLFRHCMSVPDRRKAFMIFCREALLALSPAAARIPVTPSGHPPTSWKYALYHRAKETVLDLPGPMVKLARLVVGSVPRPRYPVPSAFTGYLQDQFRKQESLGDLFDEAAVFRVLEDIDEHSFFCLWTIVMVEKAYRTRTTQVSVAE